MKVGYVCLEESGGSGKACIVYGGAVKSSTATSKTFTIKDGTDETGVDVLGGYTSSDANEWTFLTCDVGIMFPNGCYVVLDASTVITLFYRVAP